MEHLQQVSPRQQFSEARQIVNRQGVHQETDVAGIDLDETHNGVISIEPGKLGIDRNHLDVMTGCMNLRQTSD